MTKDASLFRGTQAIWYLLYIIEALLLFRFVLKLLVANPGAAFTQLIYGLSGIFVAPFQYVFNANTAGAVVFEWSTLLAMVVYYLLAVGVVRFLAMGRKVSEGEAERKLRSQEVR